MQHSGDAGGRLHIIRGSQTVSTSQSRAGHRRCPVTLFSLPAKMKSSATTSGESEQPARGPKLHLASSGKGRLFLIDTMSFIFRAYHAMTRQRPMSPRSGVPTAATYVFVNMLRKLRDDF